MIQSLINFVESFLWAHAPGLMHNNTPLLLVACFMVVCGVAWFHTKGKEFFFVGLSGLLFLVPFIKI